MSKNLNPLSPTNFSTKNFILKALPAKDLERLLPDLEEVKLTNGEIIYRADEPIEYVYFLNDSMISVIATTTQGESAEVGVIGREGIVGVNVLMGVSSTLNENIVQLPNGAHRIKTAALKKEFDRAGVFHDLALRFVNVLIAQISQTALCNRLHTVEERLSRWLLLCHDRAASDKLALTQEFLGIMLGANRATVTISAIALQSAGFVKYRRGLITIIDREGLENFSCECYRTVKNEYDRFENEQNQYQS